MSANSFSIKQKKFGLIPSAKKKKKGPPVRQKLSMFSSLEEDDEGEDDIARANKQLSLSRRVETDMSLLESDDKDGIYDYDGTYDEFKQEQTKKTSFLSGGAKEKEAPKSRYIQDLQAVAKVREIESDRRYERKLLKERKEEDEQFGDKQKFVTSAYRKKLEEEEKWAYEDRLADKIEESTGASKQGMHGFYSNLLTKNIAFGGDVETVATSAYTAGSKRQNKNLRNDDVNDEVAQEKREHLSDNSNRLHGGDVSPEKNEISSGKEQSEDDNAIKSTVLNNGNNNDGSIPAPSLKRPHENISSTEPEPESSGATSNTAMPDKESLIQSAKERYLARKAAKK